MAERGPSTTLLKPTLLCLHLLLEHLRSFGISQSSMPASLTHSTTAAPLTIFPTTTSLANTSTSPTYIPSGPSVMYTYRLNSDLGSLVHHAPTMLALLDTRSPVICVAFGTGNAAKRKNWGKTRFCLVKHMNERNVRD